MVVKIDVSNLLKEIDLLYHEYKKSIFRELIIYFYNNMFVCKKVKKSHIKPNQLIFLDLEMPFKMELKEARC